MNKTAIIIPSRLDAQRLPNKPLKLIKNKEMILHVYEAAIKSNNGNVYVATPDQKLFDLIKNIGGKVVKTSNDHLTGTDRVFEVFQKSLNSEPDIVVNSLKLVTSVLVIPSNLTLSPVDAKFIYLYDQILSVKNKSA